MTRNLTILFWQAGSRINFWYRNLLLPRPKSKRLNRRNAEDTENLGAVISVYAVNIDEGRAYRDHNLMTVTMVIVFAVVALGLLLYYDKDEKKTDNLNLWDKSGIKNRATLQLQTTPTRQQSVSDNVGKDQVDEYHLEANSGTQSARQHVIETSQVASGNASEPVIKQRIDSGKNQSKIAGQYLDSDGVNPKGTLTARRPGFDKLPRITGQYPHHHQAMITGHHPNAATLDNASEITGRHIDDTGIDYNRQQYAPAEKIGKKTGPKSRQPGHQFPQSPGQSDQQSSAVARANSTENYRNRPTPAKGTGRRSRRTTSQTQVPETKEIGADSKDQRRRKELITRKFYKQSTEFGEEDAMGQKNFDDSESYEQQRNAPWLSAPEDDVATMYKNYSSAENSRSYHEERISEDGLAKSLAKTKQQVGQLLAEIDGIDKMLNSNEFDQQSTVPDSQDITQPNAEEISAAAEYWRRKKAVEQGRHSAAIELWRKKLEQ